MSVCISQQKLGPCFGLLVMSALGIKVRVDPVFVCFLVCAQWILRFTSGATPANLLVASMAAGHVPYM